MRFLINFRAFLVLLACAAVACSGDPASRRQRYFESGNRYFDAGKWAEAALEYRNAIQIDPRFADARARLAESYVRLGNTRQALGELVRAADLMPHSLEAQLKAGQYLLAAGKTDDALVRANAALAIQGNSPSAHLLRGNALAGAKEFDKALAEIEEAIRLEPTRGTTYSQLGIVEHALGRAQAAEAAYLKAVSLAPRNVGVHLSLANFYWASGRIGEAERVFRQALELEPDHAVANRAMAAFAVSTGRVPEAEKYLKQLARVTGSSGALALADYYLAIGRTADAIDRLQPLTADASVRTVATHRIALAHARAGNRALATQLIDTLLKERPDDAQTNMVKAQLLLEDGKRDEALAYVQAAVDAEPTSAAGQFALGRLHAARGDVAAAERALRKVLDINPRAAAAQTALANLQLASGDRATALRTAQEAARTAPHDLQARFGVARALLATKDLNRAEREIAALMGEYPDIATVHALYGALAAARRNDSVARSAFERALQLDNESIEPLAGLIALDLAAKNFEAAKARIEVRLKGDSVRPELLLVAARTYVAVNDTEAAARSLRQAIVLDPSLLPAYSMLGQLYLRQGKLNEARAEFERLAGRQSRPVAALTMVGLIHYSQGDVAGARRRFEEVMATDPGAAVAANNLAWIYAEGDEKLDRALQLAQTATSNAPNLPEMHDTLGWVHYKMRQSELAAAEFQRSIEQDPANALYHYHLGLAYAQANDPERARQELERALTLSPQFANADHARKLLASLPTRGQ